MVTRQLGLLAGAMVAAACATLSPVSRIEARLVELGFSRAGAACFTDRLAADLDRDDLTAVARALDAFDGEKNPRATLQNLSAMGNPRAVGAVVAAGFACVINPR